MVSVETISCANKSIYLHVCTPGVLGVRILRYAINCMSHYKECVKASVDY